MGTWQGRVHPGWDVGLCEAWARLLFYPVPTSPWQSPPQLLPGASCCRGSWADTVAVLSLCFPRQLMENQIVAVERGAFDDMKELERL